jgi:6-phosphogluconolactonase (cycloisomerase 2 family)
MNATPEVAGPPSYAAVGCFTTPQRKARGRGVDLYRIDAATGEWRHSDHVGGLRNPSYLIADAPRGVLYVAHGDGEIVSGFALDRGCGRLSPLGSAASGGVNGVHLALDPQRRFLLVANYASGNVGVLELLADGAPGPLRSVFLLPGAPGPHRVEQVCSHPHQLVFSPSGRFLLVPDKGLDRVFVLAFDPAAGTLALSSAARMRACSGPRHLVLHPGQRSAFVLTEISSTVVSCRWDEATGALTPLAVETTLPADCFTPSTAAAIVITPDGRFLYASNRGQDGIASFAVDADRGLLRPLGCTPAGGPEPRFMTLDTSGDCLLVASEQGDFIRCLRIDSADGSLTPTGFAVPTPSPSSVAFL